MGNSEKMTKYIFNEGQILDELHKYIDNTYKEHYASQGKIQVTEFIASHCDSPDFFRGNSMKYLARYGHKEGYNRKDLMKALHYLVMMLDWHDQYATDLPSNMRYEDGSGDIIDGRILSMTAKDFEVSNTVPVSDTLTSNLYVQLEGGFVGQVMGDNSVRIIGKGALDKKGHLVPETFEYTTLQGQKA